MSPLGPSRAGEGARKRAQKNVHVVCVPVQIVPLQPLTQQTSPQQPVLVHPQLRGAMDRPQPGSQPPAELMHDGQVWSWQHSPVVAWQTAPAPQPLHVHPVPAALQLGVAPLHGLAQHTLPVRAMFVTQLPAAHWAFAVHAAPFATWGAQAPASHHFPAPHWPSFLQGRHDVALAQ